MRHQTRTERTKRWKAWVDNSWDTKKKDIYKWIRGKKDQGPLIVIPGGSAQVKDILKVAQATQSTTRVT
eukprot:3929595-Heterocapsa_arctica.AAC.1